MTGTREPFLGKTLIELEKWCSGKDFPETTSRKITRWFYSRKMPDFMKMKDISLNIRNSLQDEFISGLFPYSSRKESNDGSVKYSFQSEDGLSFETVYLPEGLRHTLCLSIQSGCRMGCKFCRTGSLGFHGNLKIHHILNQLYSIDESSSINHIVFMGMGEPFDNYDNLVNTIKILTAEWGFAIAYRHITVSTVGIQPGLNTFLQSSRCNLALSLHSPFDEERRTLIPAEKVYPFRELISEMKNYNPARKRRISVQYTLIEGLNDSDAHLKELVSLLKDSHLKLNLIRFHSFEGCDFSMPSQATIDRFMTAMNVAGIHCTVRKSRGEDIGAACGMLGNEG